MQEVTTVPNAALGVFDPANFEAAQRVAKALMASDLVPERYRPDPLKKRSPEQAMGNCLIALNMSKRMNADPLMIMQNLYVVHGNPGWSSQFLIACFNSCGRFSALQYKFSGEPGSDDYGCFAWALEHSTEQRIEGTKITLRMAREEQWSTKAGSKWKTMPDQMLRYRAATFFIRTTAPEIAMGLQTSEELEDMPRDVTPPQNSAPKPTYSQQKVKGVKEAVIEGETEPVKSEASVIPPMQSTVNPSSNWDEAKKNTVNLETGEVIKKTPQQVLEDEINAQKAAVASETHYE